MATKRPSSVQAVKRAVAILKAFTSEEPELSLADLSKRLALPKSTVARLLGTLEEDGLVAKDPETGFYRLGVELLRLANNVHIYTDLRRIARPHMRRLAEEVGESVSIAVLQGNDVVNLDVYVPPGHLVKRVGWAGRQMPAYATAAGRAILAFLPKDERLQHLEGPFQAYTSKTLIDPKRLRLELQRIRKQGYATAFEELEEGLHAVAAPVFNYEQRVIASLSVSGPGYRLTRTRVQEIAPQVVEVALAVSAEMGYRPAN
ncbi:MAG: IclR family transcriptional regulator [Chloroflexi bacterium]|nr:IclR family transcriptional regulator [Chloroflexota bacterium]